jgi:hypothetical protein
VASDSPNTAREELEPYLGQPVVVDTATPLIYIGTLSEVGKAFVTLEEVDVHDTSEGGSTKEIYALESRKFGIKKNRLFTKVRIDVIISICRLEDIIEY